MSVISDNVGCDVKCQIKCHMRYHRWLFWFNGRKDYRFQFIRHEIYYLIWDNICQMWDVIDMSHKMLIYMPPRKTFHCKCNQLSHIYSNPESANMFPPPTTWRQIHMNKCSGLKCVTVLVTWGAFVFVFRLYLSLQFTQIMYNFFEILILLQFCIWNKGCGLIVI